MSVSHRELSEKYTYVGWTTRSCDNVINGGLLGGGDPAGSLLEHNKGNLNEKEIGEIKKVIETLSSYHLGLMEMNQNYMERDLDGKPHDYLDDERNQGKETDERDETDDFVQR